MHISRRIFPTPKPQVASAPVESNKVVVHALLDGTDKDLETEICSDLHKLQMWQKKTPNAVVDITVARGGHDRNALVSVAQGAGICCLKLLMSLTSPALIALTVAHPQSALPNLTVAAMGAAAGVLAFKNLPKGFAALRAGLAALPVWSGVRHYRLGTSDSSAPKVLTGSEPEVAQFTQGLKENLAAWPNARHVVVLFGHGKDGMMTVGRPSQQITEALQEAQDAAGVAPDLTVLKSCQQGHLELLADLPGASAIACEENILFNQGDGFNIIPALEAAVRAPDAKSMGSLALEGMRPSNGENPSAAHYDLVQFREKFLPSLGPLGAQLQRHMIQGGPEKTTVLQILLATPTLDDTLIAKGKNGVNQPISRDLGAFLVGLGAASLGPETEAALKDSLESFFSSVHLSEAAKLHARGLTGVTFRPLSVQLTSSSIENLTLKEDSPNIPKEWRDFTKSLKEALL